MGKCLVSMEYDRHVVDMAHGGYNPTWNMLGLTMNEIVDIVVQRRVSVEECLWNASRRIRKVTPLLFLPVLSKSLLIYTMNWWFVLSQRGMSMGRGHWEESIIKIFYPLIRKIFAFLNALFRGNWCRPFLWVHRPHFLGPLHTRDWEPVTSIFQALSLVGKVELVQVRFTLRSRDRQSMWMQDGSLYGFLHGIKWIMFHGHLD